MTHSQPQTVHTRLEQTRDAFDSVAADYDGPRGNNALIQQMRAQMWEWLDTTFTSPSRLIDLGCGTGLDAVRMAQQGHEVTAVDWSPQMVQRTLARVASANLSHRVMARPLGAQDLWRLDQSERYDGVYSNLGPLNCVPDLETVSRECARLLKPRGSLVFTLIGRLCPWEILHYLHRGQWARATIRFARDAVPVGMNGHVIWTRYYTPREFYRSFRRHFTLEHIRGLCLFAPPPYLTGLSVRHPRWHRQLWRLDRRMAGWPLLRSCGDHFLVVLRRRG